MGKHKESRKTCTFTKRSDKPKQVVQFPTGSLAGSQSKSIECRINEEIEIAYWNKKVDQSYKKELDRFPLLAKAVYLGCERAVDELLEVGRNVNVQTEDGSTPLMIAVEKGHNAILQKLLRKGADIRIVRKNGMNALMIAVSKNEDKAFAILWSHLNKTGLWQLNHSDSAGHTLLTRAVERGNIEYTKFLLSARSLEVDRQTKDGRTALMVAVRRGHKNIVQCLLESRANVLLEDRFGATALCFAFAYEQMEIAKILQRDFNFNHRDVYVQKRIDLLSKPRQSPLHHGDLTNFYKKILFRVLLKIKKAMQDGVQLLLRHGVFSALVRFADSNRGNDDMQRLIFHVSACLMYDDTEHTTELVVGEMAASFVTALGPDYCVGALMRIAGKERWSALLPVHASCVGCPEGRRWLRENRGWIAENSAGFRAAMPTLKYWTNGERAKAERVLAQFEEIVIRWNIEDNSDVQKDCRESVINSTGRNFRGRWAPSDPEGPHLPTVEILAKKRKIKEEKELKLNDKNHDHILQKVLDSNQKSKWIFKPEIKLLPEFPTMSVTLNPNLYTGYADALKKNLNHQMEDINKLYDNDTTSHESDFPTKISMSEDVEMEDIQLTKNILRPMHHFTDNISNSEIADCLKRTSETTLEPFILPKCTSDERKLSVRNTFAVEIEGSLDKVSNNCSQVSNLSEQSKTFSIFTADQNSYTSPMRVSGENHRITNSQLNSETTLFSPDETKPNVNPDNLISSSVSSNVNFWSKIKLTPEDEDNLCLKFNNLVLDDGITTENHSVENEATLTNDKQVDPEQKNNEKIVVSRFNNVTNLIGSDINFATTTNEGSVFNQGEALSGLEEAYKVSKRSYSDVTRGENRNKSNVPFSPYLESKEAAITKNVLVVPRRTYSDVTRVRMGQIAEMEEHLDDISWNEIQNNLADDFLEFAKSGGNKTNRNNKNDLTVKSYLDQFKKEILLDQPDRNNESRQSFGTWNTSYHHDEDNCTENDDYQYSQVDIQMNDLDQESDLLEAKRVLQNPHSNQMIHNKNLGSILTEEGEIAVSNFEKGFGSTTLQNQPKQTEKLTTVNSMSQKSTPKRIIIEKCTKKLLTVENLEVPPLTCKGKLGVLQKYASFFNRMIFHCICSSSLSSENSLISNHLILYRDFVRNLLLKHGVTSKQETSIGISSFILEKMSNNSYEDIHGNNFVGLIEFFKIFFNFITVKTLKNYDSRKKLPHSSNKRQGTKEDVLMHRRIRNSGNSVECGDLQGQFINVGYMSRFINCEVGSKWYLILKNLYSCIPLSQHLLAPEKVPKCSNPTNLLSINSKVGKVVFGIGLDHTLREGTFGSYVGIVDEDGSPVVVHQLTTCTMFNDITLLYLSRKHLLKHKNLATFYDAQIDLRDHRISLIYELCEYSLPQYLKICDSSKPNTLAAPSLFRKLLIMDLLEGVRYLHRMGAVHGFLKPSNLVVTMDHRLKLTDYHLLDIKPPAWGTRYSDSTQLLIGSSISECCWRTTELIKAKNAKEARASLTAASDIQMSGMLVFYMLSGGKHPFGSTDHTCQENIKMGTRLMGPHPEDTESRDLVCEMIKGDPAQRPTIEDVMRHPYFWDTEKRFRFLLQVGENISFYTSRPNRVADDFQKSCIEARNWMSYVQRNLIKYLSKCANKIFKNEYSDLLHFAVTLQDTFEGMPSSLKNTVRQPSHYILLKFPTTFMSVYHVIRNNPLLRTQMDLQDYF